MKPEHIKPLLPDYLECTLERETMEEVKNHLENCGECNEELQQYLLLEELFAREKQIEPSPVLKERFTAMLAAERRENQPQTKIFPFKRILQVAAAVAALFLSFQAGRYLQQDSSRDITSVETDTEIHQRIAMLSLMTEESASKRIQGVSYFEEANELEEDIRNVLVNKMLYDENANVRLAAVEALSKFITTRGVKENLVTALKTEKDPVIQISLIQALARMKVKEAVEPMKNMLQNEQTQPFVKEQIQALLPSLM